MTQDKLPRLGMDFMDNVYEETNFRRHKRQQMLAVEYLAMPQSDATEESDKALRQTGRRFPGRYVN